MLLTLITKTAARLLMLICFFSLAGQAQGQEAGYGFKFGLGAYQYRMPQAQDRPRIGAELGICARFALSGRWALAPEFGYLLGHTGGKWENYLTQKGGNVVPIADARYFTHYLQIGLTGQYHFDEAQAFGLVLGPEILYLMGQTIIVEYSGGLGPDGVDYRVRETVSNPENIFNVIPRITANICSGIEITFVERDGYRVRGVAHFSHQINQFLWPAGVIVGVRFFFN
jgi:hypothetical protein